MGAQGSAEILYRKQALLDADFDKFMAEKELEYSKAVVNPFLAAKRGYIDDIIEPANTRLRICRALELIKDKVDTNPAKKHGNIPL